MEKQKVKSNQQIANEKMELAIKDFFNKAKPLGDKKHVIKEFHKNAQNTLTIITGTYDGKDVMWNILGVCITQGFEEATLTITVGAKEFLK